MNKFKIFITSFFLVCLFLASSKQAFAHATPLTYEPDASSVLANPLDRVKIRFSERVEPLASSIIIFGPDGSRADENDALLDPQDSRVFSVGLNFKNQGSYTVSWQVVSADDGHFTKGAFVFSVGIKSAVQSSSNGFQIQHSSSVPEGMTIGLELIGEALLLGLLVVVAFIWRPMRKKYFAQSLHASDVGNIIIKRLNWSLVFALILILVGGISYFVFKSNELAKLQNAALWPAFKVFFTTVSAKYTFYRLLAAVTFFLVFWVNRKKILSSDKVTRTELVLFLLLAFTAFARARVSHAAASNFYPHLSIAINAVHLYFKDLWIGGLLAMLLLLSPVVKKLQSLPTSAFIMTQFSKITAISLAVAGTTGVYVIWLHLKGFENIFTTDWGSKFIILSGFAGVLFLIRMFHQLLWEPKAVKALQNQNQKPPETLSWSALTLAFEAGMGIFVLLVTGALIITTPPITPHYNFIRQAESQGAQITLTQDPYETSKLLITLEDSKTKQGLELNNLIVSLTNPEQNIGPITAEVEKRFVGGYVVDESQLAPAGKWQVDITAQRQGAYDAVAAFSLNYPEEITFAKAHSQDRVFDSFADLSILMAIIILLVAFFLYRHSRKLHQSTLANPNPYTLTPIPSAPLLYGRGAWGVPLVVGLFILMFLSGHNHNGQASPLASAFQKLCEKNSKITLFAWHASVPERAGQATSDVAVPGCMVGVGLGQYHFADMREFQYFTRTPDAQATLHTEKTIQTGKPTTLIFSIKDYENKPVQEMTFDHDRILHTVITSQDFSVFSHVHVEDAGPVTEDMLKKAEFPVNYTFPKAGKYLVAIDYTVRAKPFSEQFYVNVTGGEPQNSSADDFSLVKSFNDYYVSLKTSTSNIKSGQAVTLDYHIEKDGKPVTDLQPYLTMPMHISVVRSDLLKFIHIHGMLPLSYLDQVLGTGIHSQHLFLPDKFGPNITANLTFTTAGTYHIFGEFKHDGKVVPTHFMVKVE